MRRIMLRGKLWEKRCDWRKDQHTDPTTYLAIVQPYGVGIYLVVRTRYGGMSVRLITDAEKYRIVAEDQLEVSKDIDE